MRPERSILTRAALAIAAVTAVALLFIGSYAGALHAPAPHDVPVAVTAAVAEEVAARLDRSAAVRVERVADERAARRAIARRDVYGAVVPTAQGGLEVLTASAAGPAAAAVLSGPVAQQLGTTARDVRPLPEADARGLVGFYTAVGWVVAGYLGATFLGLIFGTRPAREQTLWRLVGLAVLGLLTGFGGAALASAIGDLGSAGWLGLVGALAVLSVGAVTLALQSALGLVGTGVAIFLFVIAGNPSSGGPFPAELLPEPWHTIGPAIPTGAVTTAIRDVAYFPDAALTGPVLVLVAWLVAGAVAALAFGRRRGLTRDEAEVALAGAAAA